jgi:C1q domain
MTQDEFNQASANGNVNIQDPTPTPAAQTTPTGLDLSEYEGLLESLRKPRIYLSAVPTFVPKTFADSIQYVDDGSKKLCVYFKGAWQVITISGTGFSRVRAYLGSAFAFNAQGQVKFDTKDYDTNSEYDTTTGLFTPTVAGKYVIHAQLYHTTGIVGNQNGIFVYINGNQNTFSWDLCQTTGISMVQLTDTLSLAANDAVRIDAYSNANASGNIAAGQYNSFLTIHQLS